MFFGGVADCHGDHVKIFVLGLFAGDKLALEERR